VGLDLERLHPGNAFFSAPTVQLCLRRVLLVYALSHPRLAYRQGMHEVAALLFNVLYNDAAAGKPVEELVRH
jgi:TBC1 domain family member 5